MALITVGMENGESRSESSLKSTAQNAICATGGKEPKTKENGRIHDHHPPMLLRLGLCLMSKTRNFNDHFKGDSWQKR